MRYDLNDADGGAARDFRRRFQAGFWREFEKEKIRFWLDWKDWWNLNDADGGAWVRSCSLSPTPSSMCVECVYSACVEYVCRVCVECVCRVRVVECVLCVFPQWYTWKD